MGIVVTFNAMQYNTRHDFTERSTSDLKFTLSFIQECLASAKKAIAEEPDSEQVAAWAESIADYKAGIARIQEELKTR
jgi:hypothetical protein